MAQVEGTSHVTVAKQETVTVGRGACKDEPEDRCHCQPEKDTEDPKLRVSTHCHTDSGSGAASVAPCRDSVTT